MPKKNVIAIFCADIHLSHNAPRFRQDEANWYEAMLRPLEELKKLQHLYECPIICAGDIFDKWNPPAELINFAIKNLPKEMYCIPGQHDLPYHNMSDIERTSYWTLVEANAINHIDVITNPKDSNLLLYPFPWGRVLKPLKNKIGNSDAIHIAVCHKYIWIKGKSYPTANKDFLLSKIHKRLHGFDYAVFGDNHKAFIKFMSLAPDVVNCGSLMRRASDDEPPCVWTLHEKGSVKRYDLNTDGEIYCLDNDEDGSNSPDDKEIQKLIDGIEGFQKLTKDFRNSVNIWMQENDIPNEIKKVVKQALDS